MSNKSKPKPRPMRARYALVAGICVIVVVVYGSLLHAPPLTWDDGVNIFENPHFRYGSWTTLWRVPYFGMYIPVTETIWAALFQLGDGAAWPFRALDIVLHVVNVGLFAVLLQGILRRFDMERTSAFAVGIAIFALHPLQTAVVSWISGSRDLAAVGFSLAAVIVLFRRGRWAEFWATVLFAAGLLCKPQIAGVPLAIALYAWLFERDRFKRTAIVMAVWALLVVASAIVTSIAQAHDVDSLHVPLSHRPVIALDALGFYAIKTLWPFPLAADYGRTPGYVWGNPSLMLLTICVATVGGIALWLAFRRNRAFAIGALWPLLLLPVLGLTTFGYQNVSTVADHYNYLPLTIVGVVASMAVANLPRRARAWTWTLPALIIVVGGFTSWRRTEVWADDDRFYEDMLAKNPRSYSALLNLGASACDRGEWRLGLDLVNRASARDREDPGVLANRAYCLFKGNQLDDVVRLQSSLQSVGVRDKLAKNQRAGTLFAEAVGRAFDRQGFPMRAFAYFCQANALTPENPDLASMIASIHQQMLQANRNVSCPGLLAWDRLVAVAADLR